MKRHLSLMFLLVLISLLVSSKKIKAEVNEFQGKVNGDIYGQVRVIEDVDGDGNKDLIFGATDGKIHIYSSAGKEIFRPPYWPKQVNAPITSSIEVTDLDGTGNINILASTMSGTLYCLNSTGKELWKYNTSGGVITSPPVVSDLEGNGKQDIIINSGSGKVTLLQSNGHPKCIFDVEYPVRATPVPYDTNGKGVKEIVIKDSTGKISIFNHNGNKEFEWMTGGIQEGQWPFNIEVSDVDGDGKPEVFGTDSTGSSGVFNMWDNEGKLLSSFSLNEAAHGAPKVADIDGDGVDDFIIAQCDGKVLVCDKNGKCKKGWPFQNTYGILSAPSIIDLDGDGSPEIVYTCNNGAYKDEKAGCIVALKKDGSMVDDFPKFIGKTYAPLTFADLDGDGILEIIAAGGIGYTGPQLHVIKTVAKPKFKLVTLRQEVNVK